MYACKQCGTGNPLDSSFCKKCGTALPADELSVARDKLGEMLDEGNNLFTEGRTDEAMLIAEAAVTANPSSHLAYSLKGLCHERLGQIGDALECYETAVGLNADSSLDKVKVAALRNRLAQRVTDTPEPNRRSAAMIGVAAAVLFLVGGSLAAIGMSGKKDATKVAENPPATSPVNQPQTGTQQPGATGTPAGPQTQTSPNTGNVPLPQTSGTGGTGTASPVGPEVELPPAPHTLPVPEAGIGGGYSPAPISGTIDPRSSANPPATNTAHNEKPGIDPPPSKLGDPGEPPLITTKPAEEGPGYINIQMAPRTKASPGGGEAVPDGNGVKTMLEAAQQSYQTGKYEAAAGRYAQVASMGGNSPKIQQRLGDCYRNLGNTAKARTAYNRAINMYQTQIKQGSEVARNQAGLETCESALKVLGG